MNHRAAVVIVLFLSAGLLSCSASKSASSSQASTIDSVKSSPHFSPRFIYKFYMEAWGLYTSPHDKIWIDTTGQMSFDYDQHMPSGAWKKWRGFAYLEPRDEDT